MSSARGTPLPDPPALAFCEPIVLGEPAKKLLKPELHVREFIDRLVAEERSTDAVVVLSHWLPKRDAVDWACRCFRAVAGEPEKQARAAQLEAAERWVRIPDETNRRAAGAAAEAGRYESG